MDLDALRSPLDVAALRDGLVGPGMPWRQLDVVAETGSANADLLDHIGSMLPYPGSIDQPKQDATDIQRLFDRITSRPRNL